MIHAIVCQHLIFFPILGYLRIKPPDVIRQRHVVCVRVEPPPQSVRRAATILLETEQKIGCCHSKMAAVRLL